MPIISLLMIISNCFAASQHCLIRMTVAHADRDLGQLRLCSRNRVLGFVALEMKASLTNPDFAAMARAIGVHARRVEDPGELEDAIKDVFADDGPALLDVVTNTQELAMPPSVNLEQVKGFGLWAMQAVISGRGTELIDVARTNLLR
jgi:pyruvate dehydrogenase (quinone)